MAKKKPAPANESIVTVDVSDLWSPKALGGRRYNPDDLVRKRGLSIYKKMLVDEQVKAVTEFKRSAILARGTEFYWPTWCGDVPEEAKKERVEVLQYMLDNFEQISFDDAMEGIASGQDFGFSVSEIVIGAREILDKTYKIATMLLVRDPESFEFKTDDGGLLTEIKQKVGGGKDIPVDAEKVIRYVHRPMWDFVFGRSDIKEAYRAWYAKDQTVKLWLSYVERLGGGVTIANQESGTTLIPADKDRLLTVMASIASGRSVVAPPGVTIDIKFPTSSDVHQKCLEYFDLAIAKAVLVPNLLGLSHTGQTGAYSQSETQLKVFFWTLMKNAKRLESCLNEQLIKRVAAMNWEDGKYPLIRFKQATPEHIKWIIEQFAALTNAGTITVTEEDEQYFRELLGLPERNEETTDKVDPEQEANDMLNEMRIADKTKEAEQAAASAKKTETDAKKLTRDLADVVVAAVKEIPAPIVNVQPPNVTPFIVGHASSDPRRYGNESGVTVIPHGKLKYATERQFNAAVQRVAFAVIERNVESSIAAGVGRLADIVARATRRALGDDNELALLTDSDPADIAGVTLAGQDVAKLKSASSDMLAQGWRIGTQHAQTEIDRARGEPMAPETALAKFARLEDKAASYFEGKAFRMAGDTSDQTKKIIQTQLQNAVKSGAKLSDVRAAIWNELVRAGLTTREAARGIETDDAVNAALDELWVDDEKEAARYLNTLVRTNVFESLNEARFNEFTDPALGDFVVAFEFAAVMDSSTSEICTTMDGKVFSKDAPEWDDLRPPLHFNCRSVLVPITAIDGWDGKESERPELDLKGFK